VRHTKRLEELEVLVLHVLPGWPRRDPMRREQPVEVTRPRAVKAEFYRRAGERRDDASFEIHLQVDHQVELAPGKHPADVRESPQTGRAVEDDDLIHRAVAAHERSGAVLQHPGDAA
jgi:hypothetical protein